MAHSELQVGIYQGPEIPQSFQVYARNVGRHLPAQAVRLIPFANRSELPKLADVLWDIRSGGGNAPPDFLLEQPGPPLVVTVHGFAPMTLSGWEYFGNVRDTLMSRHYARQKRARWRAAQGSIGALIAVSDFVKGEAAHYTGIPPEKIHVCHHGVDHEVFNPDSDAGLGKYFFHVSNAEPRKNLARIVQAFRRLEFKHDVQLVLKLPEHTSRRFRDVEGVRIITEILSTRELAALYRGALAFLFPSLYEGFGLPILEAMGCGCPVITSNVSACPEVAGTAALTINPRSEDALMEAMRAIIQADVETNSERKAAGLSRVKDFSWEKSAARHANVLRAAASPRC